MCLRRKNVTQYMIPMPTRTVQITQHNYTNNLPVRAYTVSMLNRRGYL